MVGSSAESLLISLSLSVFSFRGRSRSVSGAVSGSWRLFTLRQPLLPVQTCCVSYSVCSKFTNLYIFYFRLFLFAPSLSFASQTSQLSLAGALVCLLTSLLPERERVRGKQKRGKWRDTEREREKETGLIRRHWVSCHNSKRSAGFFSAVRGQTQSSNWERMTGLQTSAVMHGYSSSESACKTIQMSGWSPV